MRTIAVHPHPLTPRQRSLVELAVLLLPLAPLGCTGDASAREERNAATAADGVATGVSVSEARFIRNIIGLQGPESARYDPELDAFFVSNMTGYGSAQDRNGYIVRISASNPDSASILAQGGVNDVVLDAPKGLAVHRDTLWAADISALRAFDKRTGAPLATIDFAPRGAVQLNDIAVGPDGTLHVTDTGIIMTDKGVIHVGPDRVWVVGPNQSITVAAEGTQLGRPNGITWDDVGKRWIVISFDPFNGQVMVNPQGRAKPTLIRTGKGQLDGVEALADGALLFTSWADSSVHLLANDRDRPIIREVPVAADIGIDTKRNRLAIPLSMLGVVQLWSLDGVRRPGKP
jgi:sugar lactone lactonase YvrE